MPKTPSNHTLYQDILLCSHTCWKNKNKLSDLQTRWNSLTSLCISTGLCWHLWFMFPLKAMQECPRSRPPPMSMFMSESHAATGAMSIWVACAATRCHGDFLTQRAGEGHFHVHGPSAARVKIDVSCYCYPQRPCGCWESGLPYVSMILSKSPVATEPRLIWVAFVAPWGMVTFGLELLPKAIPGFCCSWHLCWSLWPMLPKEAIGTKCVEIQGLCWDGTTLHSLWESWLYIYVCNSCDT